MHPLEEVDGTQDKSTNGTQSTVKNPCELPFTFCIMNYFGLFTVKRGRGLVIEKHWGAIFVCMYSRDFHLELVKSLETNKFMFWYDSWTVKEIRSNNGTNFVGANEEIQRSVKKMDHSKLEREAVQRGCKCVFHPPGASQECRRGLSKLSRQAWRLFLEMAKWMRRSCPRCLQKLNRMQTPGHWHQTP